MEQPDSAANDFLEFFAELERSRERELIETTITWVKGLREKLVQAVLTGDLARFNQCLDDLVELDDVCAILSEAERESLKLLSLRNWLNVRVAGQSRTLLDVAIDRKCSQMIERLVQYGAHINAVDNVKGVLLLERVLAQQDLAERARVNLGLLRAILQVRIEPVHFNAPFVINNALRLMCAFIRHCDVMLECQTNEYCSCIMRERTIYFDLMKAIKQVSAEQCIHREATELIQAILSEKRLTAEQENYRMLASILGQYSDIIRDINYITHQALSIVEARLQNSGLHPQDRMYYQALRIILQKLV